jgi:hypothetical protein
MMSSSTDLQQALSERGKEHMRTSLPVPVLLSLACLFLSSCATNAIQSSQSPITPASGNWSLKLQSAITAQPLNWGGDVSVSGNNVTMVEFDPQYARCMDALIGPMSIPVTGASGSSPLTLTSAAFDGGNVLKITLSGSDSPLTGTYAFSGGCQRDHGTFTATFVPPLSGTWSSSFALNGQPVTLTANLTQAADPGAAGVIPLTGTLTLSGASCYAGGTLDSSESYIWGNTVSAGTVATSLGVSFLVSGTLTTPANATTISASYWFPRSVCSGATGKIQLNKQ